MTIEPRHAFFETDDKVELNVFIKNVDATQLIVKIEPQKLFFEYEDKKLVLDPLRGEVDVENSGFTVGKVKVEIRLAKKSAGRWGGLTVSPDQEATPVLSAPTPTVQTTTTRSKQKNWEALAKEALEKEGKDKTTSDDPNAGGDAALNGFFQQIYAGADEDSKRAMLKSYTESGGTTLSTNWADVKKAPVEVKPPAGSEYKKYGV